MSNDAAAPAAPERSFVQNLIDVILSPREAFEAIVAKPRFWLALAFYLALVITFTAVWVSKVDPAEFGKAQLIESGQWDKMTPEQRAGAQSMQTRTVFAVFSGVGILVGTPIFLLVVAGTLLFVFRFFYAGEVTFKQSLGIVSHSFAALSLVTTPLLFLVFFLKGDWNLNPQSALQANLTLFFDHDAASKALWAFAGSIDLFSLWVVWVLAVGFGVASRKATGSAIWGVAIPWALIVLMKVGWALVF
jgi:hypothetical protein